MLRRGANFLEQRDRLSLQQIIEHFKFLINLNPRSFNTALILTASFFLATSHWEFRLLLQRIQLVWHHRDHFFSHCYNYLGTSPAIRFLLTAMAAASRGNRNSPNCVLNVCHLCFEFDSLTGQYSDDCLLLLQFLILTSGHRYFTFLKHYSQGVKVKCHTGLCCRG